MTKIPRFYFKLGSSTVPLQKVANGDISFFTEMDWSQEFCRGNSIVVVILFLMSCTFWVPGLKNTYIPTKISGDILDSVFYCLSGTIYNVITYPFCIIQNGVKLLNELYSALL